MTRHSNPHEHKLHEGAYHARFAMASGYDDNAVIQAVRRACQPNENVPDEFADLLTRIR